MKDKDKTKEQLISELVELRQRITELEKSEAERKQADEELKKEKAFTENTLNTLKDVFFVFDLENRFLRWNMSMKTVSGYSDKEISSMKPTDFFVKEDIQRVVEAIKMVAKDGYASVEATIITKNGNNIPFKFNGALLKDHEGKPIGICGIGMDITERKKAEEALQKSEARYRDLYDNAPDMYHTLDENGIIIECNETEAKMLGYKKDKIIGKHITEFFTEESKRVFESDFPKLKKESKLLNLERKIVRKDGTIFPVILNVFSEYDEKGKFVGTKTISRDVSIRKRAEEALRETRSYLENLIDYANAPIIVWDPAFKITKFNHAFEHLTGYKDKEVIGLKLHMLFPEASQEESLKKIVPTSSSKYWESVEIPILCKDGSIRIVLWNSANIYAKDATTLIATIAQGQDITERKKAEEKIRRFNRLYSMLYEINEVIIRIRGQKELFRKACQVAVEKGLFRMTWIEHIDPDSHSLKSIVHGEYGEEYLNKIRISIKEAPEGLLPISTAIREGKYIICNDFKDASCIHPCRDEAIKCGYYSMAAFPLQIGTHIIGAINFYSGEPHFFDDEEISTLTQLTGDISFALEHIEQQEQLQKRIEDLEKFYEMGIERELRIKEQKKEIKLLKDELSNYKKDNSSERA